MRSVRGEVWNQAQGQVWDRVRVCLPVWDEVEARVGDPVWEQVQVWVGDRVEDQVWRGPRTVFDKLFHTVVGWVLTKEDL